MCSIFDERSVEEQPSQRATTKMRFEEEKKGFLPTFQRILACEMKNRVSLLLIEWN